MAPTPAPNPQPSPDHDKDFDNAVKEMKKVKDPNDVRQQSVTDRIVQVFGVDPCNPPQTWNSATQQCE